MDRWGKGVDKIPATNWRRNLTPEIKGKQECKGACEFTRAESPALRTKCWNPYCEWKPVAMWQGSLSSEFKVWSAGENMVVEALSLAPDCGVETRIRLMGSVDAESYSPLL